jgi:magnesium transporter
MRESRFYHITKDGHSKRLADAKEALDKMGEAGYVWFYFYKPSLDQLTELSEPLGLHPLSIEDCLNEEQIPKMDEFEKNIFILFNSFSFVENRLKIEEVNLFLGKNFLVTVSLNELFSAKQFEEIERLISNRNRSLNSSPAYLMHVILDKIVDHKFIAIEAIEESLEKSEEQMIKDPASFDSIYLQVLRREVMALRKSIFHEREILISICRKDNRLIPANIDIYYRDIYDHLNKFFELSESFREIVTSLSEMHLSMLNNQMAISANKTNSTVQRLTFITTIFMPLTLLAGIGGMSEWSMMTGPENWKVSYSMFLFGMVVIGAANYYLLKWFDRKRSK